MQDRIGFIGTGNMGRAIIEGLINSKLYMPQDIYAFDPAIDKLAAMKEELGIQPVSSLEELVKTSDTILLAVKPNMVPAVLRDAGITPDKLVISIAAGVTLEALTQLLSESHKIVRVMPNMPALVGEGMSGVCPNDRLSDADRDRLVAIFSSFGKAELVPESLMDAVVAASGSAPAYVFMFIEALADGAVLEGMPRDMAYKFAAQVTSGAAKMVLEGMHPGQLKDMICSPGGTTIEAVKVLEKNGFRSAVIEAVHAAAEKNRKL